MALALPVVKLDLRFDEDRPNESEAIRTKLVALGRELAGNDYKIVSGDMAYGVRIPHADFELVAGELAQIVADGMVAIREAKLDHEQSAEFSIEAAKLEGIACLFLDAELGEHMRDVHQIITVEDLLCFGREGFRRVITSDCAVAEHVDRRMRQLGLSSDWQSATHLAVLVPDVTEQDVLHLNRLGVYTVDRLEQYSGEGLARLGLSHGNIIDIERAMEKRGKSLQSEAEALS